MTSVYVHFDTRVTAITPSTFMSILFDFGHAVTSSCDHFVYKDK